MIDLVTSYLTADVPVMLWGPPGTGKTAALTALAQDSGARMEVLIGSTLDPIDVAGFLVPRANGRIRQSPAPWARRLARDVAARREAWLFLDELSCAPPSVQAALLRVVQERRVGELSLAGIRVVAASNPGDTAADGGELAAATANRWAHLDWTADAATWASGTLRGWGRSHPSPRHAAIASSVAAFISAHPTQLLVVPADGASGRAWPSPRSWTASIAAMAAAPDALARRLATGCVGSGAAAEWDTYRQNQDLPDPEDLLAGRAELPSRGDRIAASLMAIVSAASIDRPERSERLLSAWNILLSQRADLGVVAARALLAASDTIPEIATAYAARLRRGGVTT